MKPIFFCGDPHGDFRHLIEAVRQHQPSTIVLLGDLQPQRPLHIELQEILDMVDIWYIHGNHDTDSESDYDNLFNSELGDKNLHGRVVELDGVRIAGLGGIFRNQVWMPPADPKFDSQDEYAAKCGKGNLWRRGLPRKHRSSIFPEDYLKLSSLRADILVTHEAPSSHPHGFEAIDELAKSLNCSKSFHGHHHDCLDYSSHRERLGFSAFGVCYRGITDCNGNQVSIAN